MVSIQAKALVVSGVQYNSVKASFTVQPQPCRCLFMGRGWHFFSNTVRDQSFVVAASNRFNELPFGEPVIFSSHTSA